MTTRLLCAVMWHERVCFLWQDTVRKGQISSAQLETLVYAGMRFGHRLPTGVRPHSCMAATRTWRSGALPSEGAIPHARCDYARWCIERAVRISGTGARVPGHTVRTVSFAGSLAV